MDKIIYWCVENFSFICLQNFKEIGKRYRNLLILEKKKVLGYSLFKYKNLRDLKKIKEKKMFLSQFDDEKSEFVVGFFKFGNIFL